MNKVNKKLLGYLSIITGFITIILGLIVFQLYKPQFVFPVSTNVPVEDPFLIAPRVSTETNTFASATSEEESLFPTQTNHLQSSARPILTNTPISTLPWMEFEGVSLLDSPTNMSFKPVCDDLKINLPQFQIIPWTPEVFSSGDFDIDKNTVVAWEHLGYTGLWIHSGTDWWGRSLAAFPLQVFLEINENGYMRTLDEFEQFALDCFIGSQVNIQVGEQLVKGKVTAFARVAPDDVDEVSTHTMDLVPYLNEKYPNRGFDLLNPQDLVLYFCGRQLNPEDSNPDYDYYTQARIIVGIQPLN